MGHFNQWKIGLLDYFKKPEGKVLDIGCNIGVLSGFVDKEKYYGIDINQKAIEEACKGGLNVLYNDVSEGIKHENDTFDLIWCSHIIEHLSPKKQQLLVNEIYRVLRPGGKALIFAPTPYHWFFWDNPTHHRPITHGSLETLAKWSKLRIVQIRYSLIRHFPDKWQSYLRLFLRPLLWEVYAVLEK